MAKRVVQGDQIVKLIVGAGLASPSPPVGPALGSKGVKSMDFCKVSINVVSSFHVILTKGKGVQRKNSKLRSWHSSACASHRATRSIFHF